MSQHSTIEWTDHTFNPWWGRTYCYAESWAKRYGHDLWGQEKSRRFFGDTHWSQPLNWNKQATARNRRVRVFCASMADVFEENKLLDQSRARLWDLIEQTPMIKMARQRLGNDHCRKSESSEGAYFTPIRNTSGC